PLILSKDGQLTLTTNGWNCPQRVHYPYPSMWIKASTYKNMAFKQMPTASTAIFTAVRRWITMTVTSNIRRWRPSFVYKRLSNHSWTRPKALLLKKRQFQTVSLAV